MGPKCGSVKPKLKKPFASHLEANGTLSNAWISDTVKFTGENFQGKSSEKWTDSGSQKPNQN